jgi:hypothetical protein
MKTKEQIVEEYKVICMQIGEMVVQKAKLSDAIEKKEMEAANLGLDYEKLIKQETKEEVKEEKKNEA